MSELNNIKLGKIGFPRLTYDGPFFVVIQNGELTRSFRVSFEQFSRIIDSEYGKEILLQECVPSQIKIKEDGITASLVAKPEIRAKVTLLNHDGNDQLCNIELIESEEGYPIEESSIRPYVMNAVFKLDDLKAIQRAGSILENPNEIMEDHWEIRIESIKEI